MKKESVEKIARSYTKPHIEVVRAQAQVMYKAGLDPQQIAAMLPFKEATVRSWLHRFNECGLRALKNRRPLKRMSHGASATYGKGYKKKTQPKQLTLL